MSKKKAPSIAAKPRCTMSEMPPRERPPTLGLVLAGGLARRMGGGDKARIGIGGTTILRARARI